jgi:hypothetical protein
MVILLEEAKVYLRVDVNEEYKFITNFMTDAEEICEGILRYSLLELSTMPENGKASNFICCG